MLYAVFLIAVGAAAATGMIFKPGTWYDSLRKPGFTPPKLVFPIVWTVLYLLLAWVGARLAVLPGAGLALALWAAQIALNTLWTPVFFGARRIGMGVIVIALLWVVVAALTFAAWRVDFWAGVALLPYLAWITLATALNWRIWRDNPPALAPRL